MLDDPGCIRTTKMIKYISFVGMHQKSSSVPSMKFCLYAYAGMRPRACYKIYYNINILIYILDIILDINISIKK